MRPVGCAGVDGNQLWQALCQDAATTAYMMAAEFSPPRKGSWLSVILGEVEPTGAWEEFGHQGLEFMGHHRS